MRNFITFFIIITINNVLSSQESKKTVVGKIFLDSISIPDVHIINQNTKEGVISNDFGEFEILVSKNDILYLSHINLESKKIIITDSILNLAKIYIQLLEKSVTLKEVVIGNNKSIFYVDKDIMSHNAPIVNARTLNLPYANTKIEKDNSLLKVNSGFALSFDGILNRMSGSYKRAKIAKKLQLEDKRLLQIRKHYTDDFFITDLGIKKAYINRFLNYCVHKNIIKYYRDDNQLKLVKILIDESKEFPYKIEQDSTLLTKK